MTPEEKIKAIAEVIKWIDSGRQSKDNGLEEIKFILEK